MNIVNIYIIDYVFASAILRPSYGNDNQTGRKTA